MNSPPRLGVFTQTIIRSPLIKTVLHARIRNDHCNDVIFVGSNFIDVKQVEQGGNLRHIATKRDFGAQILAARTFSVQSDAVQEEGTVKQENGTLSDDEVPTPPQFLVVTLDSDDLMFLYLAEDDQGSLRFVHKTCPMPTYDRLLRQTGVHLAVDPFSRAIAVGANEHDIIVYSAKPKHRIRTELLHGQADWCPVGAQRMLQVEGVILHMEFLIPRDSDQDHIVLLLIVVDERKTKAMWIDWYFSSDLSHIQHHPSQPIDSARSACNMLIPLKESAFLLANGTDMRLYRDILSGSVNCVNMQDFEPDTPNPGSSPRAPLWVSWCRPRRNRAAQREQDILYLVREDGMVYLVHISAGETRIQWSLAGNTECHVGAAFASLGDEKDPDILAIVGDMSSGKVTSIGAWPDYGRVREPKTRADTMTMQTLELLPNWASGTDMLVSSLPQAHGKSVRSRDSVFITSGRQPHGTITELRKGLEARVSTWMESAKSYRGVTDAWVLPNRSTGSVLFLLSTPSHTQLLDYDVTEDEERVGEHESEEVISLDLSRRTLAADILSNGYLIQITDRSICVAANLDAGFEDLSRWDCEDQSLVVAAAVEPLAATALIIRRTGSYSEMMVFKHKVEQDTAMPDGEEEGLHPIGDVLSLQGEPICLATAQTDLGILSVIATASGTLHLILVNELSVPALKNLDVLRVADERESVCDSLVLLHPQSGSPTSGKQFLAVCGLRDGNILSIEVSCTGEPAFGQRHENHFGQSTVRLDRHSNDWDRAYATSGRDLCMISWDGQAADSLIISSVWISDKARPELTQDIILAVSKMPSAEYIGNSYLIDNVVLVSPEEIWLASIREPLTTIPRQIKVTGTPNRLIYCQQLRSLVCASVCYRVRSFPSAMPHGKPEERRQIWPAIDFIPINRSASREQGAESNTSVPSFTFDYQPGDRIYAMCEWSFNNRGKLYSFLLVAGSYVGRSGQVKGRVSILQPSIVDWEVRDVREGRSYTFDAPVYALALYDELTYVACAGDSVVTFRYSTDERKWQAICASFRLPSPGIHVSVTGPSIILSTQKDSLVALKLVHLGTPNAAGFDYKLVGVASAPCLAPLQSHTTMPRLSNGADPALEGSGLAIMSTKDGRVLGLTSPVFSAVASDRPPRRPRMAFEAQLPCSLTSLKQGNTLPPWHAALPSGVLTNGVVGVAADGGLVRISVLDEGLWRRLFWLQRICEWSTRFSPHELESPNFAVEDMGLAGSERGFPIGLSAGGRGDIALFAATDHDDTSSDMHIDGDVLSRLLDNGALGALQGVIREMALRNDRIGDWVKEHLDEELEAAGSIMDELRVLLACSL